MEWLTSCAASVMANFGIGSAVSSLVLCGKSVRKSQTQPRKRRRTKIESIEKNYADHLPMSRLVGLEIKRMDMGRI